MLFMFDIEWIIIGQERRKLMKRKLKWKKRRREWFWVGRWFVSHDNFWVVGFPSPPNVKCLDFFITEILLQIIKGYFFTLFEKRIRNNIENIRQEWEDQLAAKKKVNKQHELKKRRRLTRNDRLTIACLDFTTEREGGKLK